MKRKLIISSIIGASLFASFTIGAYAASKTSLFINGQKSNIAVKVIEGVSYVPLKDISKVFDASITYNSSNNSLNLNSSNISNSPTSTLTQATTSLKDAKSIEKYLNETYGVKSPLKTSLTEIKFSFSVTENKSKFEAYDLLINFHYDVRSVDQLIFDNQNSIDANAILKATKTESQIRQFIEEFAKDIASKLPTKKIKGITDGSYYKYPTLKVDPVGYVKNIWVTYEFKDPTSYFADYNSPLAEYSDTKVSTFKWAPIK